MHSRSTSLYVTLKRHTVQSYGRKRKKPRTGGSFSAERAGDKPDLFQAFMRTADIHNEIARRINIVYGIFRTHDDAVISSIRPIACTRIEARYATIRSGLSALVQV